MIFEKAKADIEHAVQTALEEIVSHKFGVYENYNQVELHEVVNVYNELHEIVPYKQIIETIQAYFWNGGKDDV